LAENNNKNDKIKELRLFITTDKEDNGLILAESFNEQEQDKFHLIFFRFYILDLWFS
jgi:hypothetical protein